MDSIVPGSMVGPYTILKVLPEGQGGMARVYQARVRLPGRTPHDVALKVMRTGEKSRQEDRFFFDALNNEVEILRRLRHPNVIRIYPIPLGSQRATPFIARDGNLPGSPWYFVMEHMKGGSLHNELKQRNRLPLEEALEIASQIGMALDYIRSRGIAHRDVKPDNVLFRQNAGDGGRIEPVLIDFGIAAKLQRLGLRAGSIHYMSPERLRAVRGETAPEQMIDYAAGDVYSLGALLYQMLTGRRPFEGRSKDRITDSILHSTPTFPSKHNPEIPPKLEQVIMRALEKEPSQRPMVGEMVEQLEQAVPPPWVSISAGKEASAFEWRSLLPWFFSAVVTLCLILSLAWNVYNLIGPSESSPTAVPATTTAPTNTLTPSPQPTTAMWTPTPTSMPPTPTEILPSAVATATQTPSVPTPTPVPTHTSAP